MKMDMPGAAVTAVLIVAFLQTGCTAILVNRKLEYACQSLSFPFCNTSISIEGRVQDLISRLALPEKIEQLGNQASSISRLGIPSYQWWQEALHGVADSPGVNFSGPASAATSFPQTILMAASFNSNLVYRMAEIVSTEARAMFNLGQSGLTFWSPNVNIFRDPRWGRGQETPGEDPLWSRTYAANFVRGMQGAKLNGNGKTVVPSRLKTSACCKHFTAYDLENWEGVDRDHFNAVVTKQDLEDTFNPPFQGCIEDGEASGLMCSYNRLNGVPTCASYSLLTETARHSWGFKGYVVSDCDAVYNMCNDPKYAETLEDAVADALQAGMDLNCGITVLNHAESAYNQGKLGISDIDRALHNLLFVQFRLGLFDGNPETQEYGNLGFQDVCTAEHIKLALEAALQGIVLLKNQDNVLPLGREDILTLAVVGPSSNGSESQMLGNYAGIPCQYITPLQGLSGYVNTILYEPGCSFPSCEENDFNSAALAASNADAVVIVVGLSQEQEREGLDRTSLLLPGQQQSLVSRVANSSKGPVILVIMSGGPVDVTFARNDHRISSILWVGYPGEAGGQAIAKIIFGDHNPGGRLPMTWYPESFTQVQMTNMNMRPNISTGYPGRTYRFYTGETVFKFGEGLSYTTFTHFISAPTQALIPVSCQQTCYKKSSFLLNLRKSHSEYDMNDCDDFSFHVKAKVKNIGSRSGSNVLLLYLVPPNYGNDGSPLKQLVRFMQVHLGAGEEKEIDFLIQPCADLSTVKADGSRSVDAGIHKLILGEEKFTHKIMLKIRQSSKSSI